MKIFLLTLCLALGVLAQDQFDAFNENFNIPEVLHNGRLMNAYAKCLLNQGPCTAEIKRVKDQLPAALKTRCAKCTEKQKKMAKQLATGVKTKYPEIWKELVAMYDPQGTYQQAWQDFLKN